MAALLEKDELCPGNVMRELPCGERGNIHIVTAADNQHRELKARKLRREVQIGGGFCDRFANCRLKSEIAHLVHLRFTFLRRKEDSAATLPQAGPRRRVSRAAQLLLLFG